ncbi:Glycogen phosphorylase [Chlamydiales bacterium STE3]|nr:Glycogen phosphorylase [Chlamydiales bacterium STE3]
MVSISMKEKTMSANVNLEAQADVLLTKVSHYLITVLGKTVDEANNDELYRALSYALREEIMANWLACSRTYEKQDVRWLFYLSLEYMPGRILSNNITNVSSIDIVRIALQKLNRGFADIIRLEADPGLGNGGLGRLASCFLDSLATLHYPARAYGLRYQYGIFEQQLWDGNQIEAPDCWLINEYPWEFRRDLRKVTVKYCGEPTPSHNIHGDEIMSLKGYEEVWALPYDIPIVGYAKNRDFSVVTLRLWSTKESPRNFQLQRYNAGRLDQAAENTTLTDVLYPSDHHETGKRVRLKQEYLLVAASLQDIFRHYMAKHENLRDFSDKVRIQINDTHPSLVIPEMIRILMQKHDIPWKMAVDITQAVTGYTNHTILEEALEQWDQSLLYYLLPRQCRIIERLNYELCNTLRTKHLADEGRVQHMSIIEKGKVRMANLAIVGSHKVNGVAEIHSNILKNEVFRDFADLDHDKFINITNGVTQRRWLLHANPELAHFITKRIGEGWITDFPQIKKLAAFTDDGDTLAELQAIKRKNKLRFIEFINKENKLRDTYGHEAFSSPLIDVDSLFDVQIKRIHEYKRQLMNALHLIMLYQEILENPETTRVKRTAIFGGKAAGSYETAKAIIRLICCIARKVNRDPIASKFLKIIYVENYNVSRAEIIIPAADLSEQISTAGNEASGTGNMKLAINGALTIGTDDGANIEMKEQIGQEWFPFTFGASAREISELKHSGKYSPQEIYLQNAKIHKAVDSLRDRTFAINDEEHQAFSDLFHKLLESHYGGPPDRYFTLHDLQGYYDTQLKVEEFYKDPDKWQRYALLNIAGMGQFSTDISIKNYSDLIWQLTPCPMDQEILENVRHVYNQYDKCRIY